MNINRFFEDVIHQNEKDLREYFCGDAVIRWHCSNELFTVEEYVRANCEYPGVWRGEIERLEEYDNGIILAARVCSADGSSSNHVVSFITLRDDRIAALDEYWGDDGDVPEWRRKMHIGRPIRQFGR